MKTELEKKFKLLIKPVWTVQDIMVYFDGTIKSKPTAYRIKDKARDLYDGKSKLGKQYIKRDAIMQCFGTTTENELRNLKAMLGDEDL